MSRKKKKKKKKRKKAPGHRKGSEFERQICKRLSLWWTDGKRDDVFWRTSGSGARATSRMKMTGKSTFGQVGDVQATDPEGQPLLDLCVIEVKRGYSEATLLDFIEGKIEKPQFQSFIEQAIKECEVTEDGKEWILVVKRDYKEAVLLTSLPIHSLMGFPVLRLRLEVGDCWEKVNIMNLDDFFTHIDPKRIKGWKHTY